MFTDRSTIHSAKSAARVKQYADPVDDEDTEDDVHVHV